MESEIEASSELTIRNATSDDKSKVVVAPYRKAKQVRSNKQALCELANGLKALAETSQKNNKMMIEEERKRKDIFHFEERKSKRIGNMSALLLNALQPQFPYRFQFGHQGNSSTSSTSDPYQPVQDDIRRESSFYPF